MATNEQKKANDTAAIKAKQEKAGASVQKTEYIPKASETPPDLRQCHSRALRKPRRKHPDAADPLMRWAEFVEKTEWKSHAELKQAFPSADYVGNDRYVFNISGNKFRLVTIVVFFQGFLHIRFVGTHAEYDKIKDIKNI